MEQSPTAIGPSRECRATAPPRSGPLRVFRYRCHLKPRPVPQEVTSPAPVAKDAQRPGPAASAARLPGDGFGAVGGCSTAY
ncbi:hypothetical protein AMIS_71150 [Actinoplanes missouriensis 431]|uniref:Uncharacterized protein n=1 Tax=Actinoplanes missouriensis (strain ATCC 14538 / DSM 43046 / CBS 188.64 / JCM 3121 / NBRC 102363 / NCIMB 12654 / NRRL B-3342 / UNCC 431) TaxID=512565 RepID=I0HH48_ACTM4|nr:hypothetical protein AMIS_71150 [Actinoplanes missouriensis 431]